MSKPAVLIDKVWEDGSATFRGRFAAAPTVFGSAGTPRVQADYTAISYSVFDKNTDVVVGGHDAVALTVSAVIFDTLQGWGEDPTGYNFSHTVAETAFPTGGVTYIVEYRFTLASGVIGWAIAEVSALHVRTS